MGNGYLDGLFVFGVDDDAAQLAQMAGRHDDRHVVGEGLVDFYAAHAEPVAVGCSSARRSLAKVTSTLVRVGRLSSVATAKTT